MEIKVAEPITYVRIYADSDGEVRSFGPGAVLLVEDTSGKGHISRVKRGERGSLVAIPLV